MPSMEWWRANLTTMSWVCAMLHAGRSESACKPHPRAHARAPQLTFFLPLTPYKLLWLPEGLGRHAGRSCEDAVPQGVDPGSPMALPFEPFQPARGHASPEGLCAGPCRTAAPTLLGRDPSAGRPGDPAGGPRAWAVDRWCRSGSAVPVEAPVGHRGVERGLNGRHHVPLLVHPETGPSEPRWRAGLSIRTLGRAHGTDLLAWEA